MPKTTSILNTSFAEIGLVFTDRSTFK